MKKLLIFLFFTLFFLTTKSQTEFNFSSSNYGQFQLSSQAFCGKGSLYCVITKSLYPNGFGNYCYQVYFATNSYFSDCNVSRTYVPNIEVMYVEGKYWYYPVNFQKFWVTVGPTSCVYTLFHPNPNLIIKIKTGFVEPTIY
jgi:hypothetical protein